MVAPVDVYVCFCTLETYERFHEQIEKRASVGAGYVTTFLAQGEISAIVEAARVEWGGVPLGIVTANEGDALEAIRAGADEAHALPQDQPSAITVFLDRTRVRAAQRRERERQTEDFVQAEKLTALGTLVAGVGHELNNPLSTITLGFDVLREVLVPDLNAIWEVRDRVKEDGTLSPQDSAKLLKKLSSRMMDVRGLLTDLSTSTEAVSQLVQDLRVFSRHNISEHPALFQPRVVIDQAIRLVRREFGPNTVIEQDYADTLPELLLQRNRLAQVITNLLVNAAHAIRGVHRETHTVRISARVDDEHLALSISDTGPGIPEEALERIFDPFFTTKREGEGTGLGLSISRSIIIQMGGDLAVTSVLGEGATFICFLPLPTERDVERSKQTKPRLPQRPQPSSKRSVLIIDDDERVLRATSRSLRDSYKVLIARDGQEATDLLMSGSHADAIVMELDLPETDGPTFYQWLLSNRPDLAKTVVVATAAQEQTRFLEFLKKTNLTALHKPIGKDELFASLEAVLNR